MRSNQNSPKKPAAPAAKSVPKKNPATVKPAAKVSGPPDKRPVHKPTPARVKPTLKDPVPAPPRKLGPNPQSVTKPANSPKKAPARPVPIPPKTTGADQGKPAQARAQSQPKATPIPKNVAPVPVKKTLIPGKPNQVPKTPTREKTIPNRAPKRSMHPEKITEPEDIAPRSIPDDQVPQADEEENSQHPSSSSKKISWKQVVKNVFRFYFCLCLPEKP